MKMISKIFKNNKNKKIIKANNLKIRMKMSKKLIFCRKMRIITQI